MSKRLTTFPVPTIGGGYSTDMRMATTQSCLLTPNSSIVYSDGAKSTISLGNSMDFFDFELQVLGNIGLSIDLFILASANGVGNFLLAVEGGIYSQSYYFSETISLPTQIFNPVGFATNALNAVGLNAYNNGSSQFRAVCGDQFIQQVSYGAGLFIAYQIDFVSLEDKLQYSVNVPISILMGLFDININIQKIMGSNHLDGIITLFAYQNGGNSTELSQIFAHNMGGFYLTACTFSNLEPCNAAVNATIDYAVNNFPYQVNITNGEFVGNVSSMGYTYFPYTMIGFNTTSSALTPEAALARATLSDTYSTLEDQNTFIGHLLSSWVAPYMASNIISYLQNTQTNITSNIAILDNPNTGAVLCYRQPQNCVAIAFELLSSLNQVDDNFIDSFTQAYQLQYVYCGNINAGNINGTAIPLGNNNFIKVQGSGYKEMLQVSSNENSITLTEPNISNDVGFTITLTQDDGAYYGNTTFNSNCFVQCSGIIVDNPV
jgi:hypothetical protein